ncbi:hypothetical protein TWF788_000135 [Orbilia oligospora]|uniref:Uncharacterized protein n=1 Tax=Orbilia oligospora TaxID=2813651 RepID=A0A7C8UEF7_ORBOL|nr:hypothetical protein TWF788_000135 [Orbilia oligospora]
MTEFHLMDSQEINSTPRQHISKQSIKEFVKIIVKMEHTASHPTQMLAQLIWSDVQRNQNGSISKSDLSDIIHRCYAEIRSIHCDLFDPLDLNESVESTISVAQPSQSIKAYAGLLEPIDSSYDYEDWGPEHLFQSYSPDTWNSGQQEFPLDNNEPLTFLEDRASALRFVAPDPSAGRGFLINDRDNELPSSRGPAITHPDNHIFAPYLLSPISITLDSSKLPSQNSGPPAWEFVQEFGLPMTRLNQKKISKKRQGRHTKLTKPKIERRSSARIQEAMKIKKKQAEKRSNNRPNKYFLR